MWGTFSAKNRTLKLISWEWQRTQKRLHMSVVLCPCDWACRSIAYLARYTKRNLYLFMGALLKPWTSHVGKSTEYKVPVWSGRDCEELKLRALRLRTAQCEKEHLEMIIDYQVYPNMNIKVLSVLIDQLDDNGSQKVQDCELAKELRDRRRKGTRDRWF